MKLVGFGRLHKVDVESQIPRDVLAIYKSIERRPGILETKTLKVK